MWKRLSLRARIFLLLTALICTTLLGALVTLWHTRAMDSLLVSLIDKNVASFQAAEQLENLLAPAKRLPHLLLPGWQSRLAQADGADNQRLWGMAAKGSEIGVYGGHGGIMGQIDTQFQAYIKAREKVISLYREGEREAGARLHWEVRRQYVDILNLCKRYKLMHEYAISRARIESQARARFINAFALVAVPPVTILGVLLAYILIKQILGPIRQFGPGDRSGQPGGPGAG